MLESGKQDVELVTVSAEEEIRELSLDEVEEIVGGDFCERAAR